MLAQTQRHAGDSQRENSYTLRGLQDMTPRQYAIPALRDPKNSIRSSLPHLSYVQHELLRQRKTPHGRMLEPYDDPYDQGVQFPATKHVLLSSSPDDSLPAKMIQDPSVLPRQPSYRNDPVVPNLLLKQQSNFSTIVNKPSWDFPGGLDSVLNQSLPLQQNQRYFLQHGSNVPTVLPTAYQTYFGPTASAGQEYYGPYWPDGTYMPYRPASVRDSRFFLRDQPTSQQHRSYKQQSFPGHTLRRSARLPLDMNDQYGLSHVHQPLSASSHPQKSSTLQDDLLHPQNGAFRQYQASGIPLDSYSNTTISQLPLKAPENTLRYSNLNKSFQLKPEQKSHRLAYRDHTFTWANRIYTELLASIQKSRRNGKNSISETQVRTTIKPVIFPRPPQRTESHFQEDARSDSASNRSSGDEHMYNHNSIDDTTESRPRTAMRLPQPHKSGPTDDSCHLLESQFDTADTSTITKQPKDQWNGTEQTTHAGSDVSQIKNSAMNALTSIEILCQEAETSWIDGMLLAGCLAYGLGDYYKALMHFNSILEKDPSHVEAMSNLAATLFALNRRDEALSYWTTAVRIRPSFFEAVEHLIGLLCGGHRAKEAVEIIDYVENALRLQDDNNQHERGFASDTESESHSRSSSVTFSSLDRAHYDYESDHTSFKEISPDNQPQGFGSSGFAIPAADNGRMLALIHAKGNMLYSLGNNQKAAGSFEDAVLIATGQRRRGVRGLIERILSSCSDAYQPGSVNEDRTEPVLLSPTEAEMTVGRLFPPFGNLPGLESVPPGLPRRSAISTTSNSLLSLAKIYQDGMSSSASPGAVRSSSVRDILALYYLSLSLQRSPSTANNVGILLAGVQQTVSRRLIQDPAYAQVSNIPGVVPGSGIALALSYYNYGLNLDSKHAHLYTNLGSLLKDIGQLNAAIRMYESAVICDGNFDIALANLANAVKDQGKVADAIRYYKRAVAANPDFAEAVCGLATALNSICSWKGRGGVYADQGKRDRIHVDDGGLMQIGTRGSGWINRVVEIVQKQLAEGERWGIGVLTPPVMESLCSQLRHHYHTRDSRDSSASLTEILQSWSGKRWEGSRIVRLVERAIRHIGWQWYQDRYVHGREFPARKYCRPHLPASLTSPSVPTVLPFHTFTAPLSAKQIRQISQRNALRISVSTLRSNWLPQTVYPPPAPPNPYLIVGYVSSDFNNHPLAHLMQSVFGFHDLRAVRAICYATSPSDGSQHRQQIEREAPAFRDASNWNVERLVKQIVSDGVHILVNLNGYTRGARNEVFAARPAPIQMSFMGFAGTLGAEWCDYVLADLISVPEETLSSWRYNVNIDDRVHPKSLIEDEEDWIYSENIIFTRDTFFCVDHRQSAPGSEDGPPPLHNPYLRETAWEREQERRWRLRKEIFPTLSDSAIILGNFNQLYKIDPTTFRMYLRILTDVPNAVLWLLRFPDLGEHNLLGFAKEWAGPTVADRIVFTDVAPKGAHINRASVVDLFLDTPECNAHTTAADVIWSGTPIVTLGKWRYKMCSRMAGSIVASALPLGVDGDEARNELLVQSEEEYEARAVDLARDLRYSLASSQDFHAGHGCGLGRGQGRLMDLRRMLWEGRWTSRLFDTRRWVRDTERAYWEAWKRWESGTGGDIYL